MKSLLCAILLISTSLHAASLSEGTYIGVDEQTNRKCSVRFELDADYAYSSRSEYRITVHHKGPFIDCEDYSGHEYMNCASGDQTNGDRDKSLYILGFSNNIIKKVYFQDDSDSSKEKVCINLMRRP